ncbi:MAG TPA: FAD:protein FMN transferase, partial [Acidimicrobiales bacterium]|nr:FAD:protein FMN transferase [Acidimicrobiales bacterium]
ACNRFRNESEISRVNARAGETVAISATLELALSAALLAREATDGLCDPSVLPALLALGYDVDYDELKCRDETTLAAPVKGVGVDAFILDRREHTVTLAPNCQLDLGGSAKALVADLIADDVAPTGGVVVEVGGDVAVRGRGSQGAWAIGLSDSLALDGKEPRVAIHGGGVATSSTTTRTWRASGQLVNHIVDPRTGSFAVGPYATATVSASSCVLANAFATASLLWGEEAAYHVAQAGWSGRFVRTDGSIEFVGGWPVDEEPA